VNARLVAQGGFMSSRIGTGVAGGVVAGVVFGLMMQSMSAPTPDGGEMPMMAMVGAVVGSPTVAAGWAYHLLNSAVIGGLFGWLLGDRIRTGGASLAWGVAYGVAWWVLGALILMPALLGMPIFAPLLMPPMRVVAMSSLVGHIMFGLTLGGVYLGVARPKPALA
jgi:hypothetical protein